MLDVEFGHFTRATVAAPPQTVPTQYGIVGDNYVKLTD